MVAVVIWEVKPEICNWLIQLQEVSLDKWVLRGIELFERFRMLRKSRDCGLFLIVLLPVEELRCAY